MASRDRHSQRFSMVSHDGWRPVCLTKHFTSYDTASQQPCRAPHAFAVEICRDSQALLERSLKFNVRVSPSETMLAEGH
jgi:hypothetical protein